MNVSGRKMMVVFFPRPKDSDSRSIIRANWFDFLFSVCVCVCVCVCFTIKNLVAIAIGNSSHRFSRKKSRRFVPPLPDRFIKHWRLENLKFKKKKRISPIRMRASVAIKSLCLSKSIHQSDGNDRIRDKKREREK